MAKVRVHILNFHGPCTHIELVLENKSTTPSRYYSANRWSRPAKDWSSRETGAKNYLSEASSQYSFDIIANPEEIISAWWRYHRYTSRRASVLGENCAVATQRFLTHFANVPAPSASHRSVNHLIFGLVWPVLFHHLSLCQAGLWITLNFIPEGMSLKLAISPITIPMKARERQSVC